RNLPNGKEQARARVREIVSPGMEGEGARRLDSQRDLLEASEGGARGWETFPEALAARGAPPGATTSGAAIEGGTASDRLAAAYATKGPPDRASALLHGRPGASLEGAGSWAAPAPVRSTLPDTLHFD